MILDVPEITFTVLISVSLELGQGRIGGRNGLLVNLGVPQITFTVLLSVSVELGQGRISGRNGFLVNLDVPQITIGSGGIRKLDYITWGAVNWSLTLVIVTVKR